MVGLYNTDQIEIITIISRKTYFDRGVNQIQYRPDALTNEKALIALT